MCSTRGRANCAVHNSKAEFYHGIFSSFERKRSGSRFHEDDSRLDAAHEEPTNVEEWRRLSFNCVLVPTAEFRIPWTLKRRVCGDFVPDTLPVTLEQPGGGEETLTCVHPPESGAIRSLEGEALCQA